MIRLIESTINNESMELVDNIFNSIPNGLRVVDIISILQESMDSADRLASFIITELSTDNDVNSLDIEVNNIDNSVEVLLNSSKVATIKCYGVNNFKINNEIITKKREVIISIKKIIKNSK